METTYTITLGLDTNEEQNFLFNKKFNIARIQYNLLTSCVIKRLNALRQDKIYLKALNDYKNVKSLKSKDIKKLEITDILNERISYYKLTKGDLEKFLDNNKNQYKKLLGSTLRQKIALRVYNSLSKVLYSKGKKLHYKKYGQLLSIEGKSNKTDIVFKNNQLYYRKYNPINIKYKPKDYFIQESLSNIENGNSKICFCRIIKKYIRQKEKYYLQLIIKGEMPPKRYANGKFRKTNSQNNRVGIDIGTSTIAIVSNKKIILQELAEKSKSYNIKLTKISHKLEKERRLSNPLNYNEDGTIKKGRLKWIRTKKYIKLLYKIKNIYRLKSNYIKESHSKLCNEILLLGNEIYIEEMNFSGLAKKSQKEREFNQKTNKYKRKKRFGKSILDKAPSNLIIILERKLKYDGVKLNKVNTQTFKASQYNHIEDKYIKKPLSQRINKIGDDIIQRDIYSAYLLMNSKPNLKEVNKKLCDNNYKEFLINHKKCIKKLKEKDKKYPKSFGLKYID